MVYTDAGWLWVRLLQIMTAFPCPLYSCLREDCDNMQTLSSPVIWLYGSDLLVTWHFIGQDAVFHQEMTFPSKLENMKKMRKVPPRQSVPQEGVITITLNSALSSRGDTDSPWLHFIPSLVLFALEPNMQFVGQNIQRSGDNTRAKKSATEYLMSHNNSSAIICQ